jgi:hypothetical protein
MSGDALSSEPDKRARAAPRRLRLGAGLVALAAAGTTAALLLPAHGVARAADGGPAIAVGVGDIVKVAGAPIGCAVRLQDGVPALDCRRIGPLRGTYGTILTGRKVLVVRFLDAKAARIVFSADHRRLRSHTCG